LDDIADGAVPSPPEELSGSGSDEDDDGTETEQEGPDWTPATNGNKSTDDATPQAPPPDLLSPQAMMELLATTVSDVVQRPSEWLPFGSSGPRGGLSPAVGSHQAEASGYDTDGALTIFAVNEQVVAHSNRLFQFLKKWSKKRVRVKKVKKALRSTLDPRARQQRREARKWRMWHDIFCVLNDIERQLGEALGLLMQASASMRRFGESHGQLNDFPRLSAFLGDAALYFRSEVDVPKRLEARLGDLESIADEFRGVSISAPAVGRELAPMTEGPQKLHADCEDLQVDIAVLLESALMAAQQALAEYKRMHCRLELLATEYESVCNLELDNTRPVFLPIVTEESQVAATALPEQAVQWALDFAQLVGTSSSGLESLVREAEVRRQRIKRVADELRAIMMRYAATGGQQQESRGLMA
jgi:hypothetical protein